MVAPVADTLALLLSFDEKKNESTISFCQRWGGIGNVPQTCVTVPPSPKPNSPASEVLSTVVPIQWVEGIELSDLCDIATLKLQDSMCVSNRSSSRPELLSIIGSLIDHGWELMGSTCEDRYLFEKVVAGDVPPPPPPVVETPPLPPPKTPGMGLGRKETIPEDAQAPVVDEVVADEPSRISLTNEQETTSFKQKMIFGINVKKIPHIATAATKDVALRLSGSGRDLKVTWGSKKDGVINVRDIVDVMASDKLSKKVGDKGKSFTISTNKRTLNLMASSQKECFWFIRGFDGLIKEAQTAGSRMKKKRQSIVDEDLAAELFGDDGKVEKREVEDKDLIEIIKNVEIEGEVKLKRGKTLSERQLLQIQETFETRQGAASVLQKIVRKMVSNIREEICDFSPEELMSCFKIFDEDGDGSISTLELRHVLTNIGGLRMSEQECKDIIRRFDRDSDGSIDYKEFALGLLGGLGEERESILLEVHRELDAVKVSGEVERKEIIKPVHVHQEDNLAVNEVIVVEDTIGGGGVATVVSGLGGVVLPMRDSYNANKQEETHVETQVEAHVEAHADAQVDTVVKEKEVVAEEDGAKRIHLVGADYNKPVEVTETPLGWSEMLDEGSGEKYWYNYQTGESSWTYPEATTEAEKAGGDDGLPEGWQKVDDEAYGCYYWHAATGETSYEVPGKTKANEGGALPEGWTKVEDETHGIYYYNEMTGETSWEFPGTGGGNGDLPAGWEEVNDPTYGVYYYDASSGVTSYEKPT